MEDIREKRRRITSEIEKRITGLEAGGLAEKKKVVIERVFDFANFVESRIALLYMPGHNLEFDTREIIKRAQAQKKIIVLPLFDREKKSATLYKVDDIDKELVKDGDGRLVPDPKKCREIPIDNIDIALVPGIAFDEKGGRIGGDAGEFDRLMGKLPITTRKVAAVLEEQVNTQIPMESKARYVDIVITDKRVIYKI